MNARCVCLQTKALGQLRWNEQTRQAEILETKASYNKARPTDLDHSKSAVLDLSTPGEIIAKTLKSRLLHSFEVLDPIRFPRFSAIG